MNRSLVPAAALLLTLTAPLRANPVVVPDFRPRHSSTPVKPDNAVPFRLEVCPSGQEPRLIVPRKLLARGRSVASVGAEKSQRASTVRPLLPAFAALALGACLTLGLARG